MAIVVRYCRHENKMRSRCGARRPDLVSLALKTRVDLPSQEEPDEAPAPAPAGAEAPAARTEAEEVFDPAADTENDLVAL